MQVVMCSCARMSGGCERNLLSSVSESSCKILHTIFNFGPWAQECIIWEHQGFQFKPIEVFFFRCHWAFLWVFCTRIKGHFKQESERVYEFQWIDLDEGVKVLVFTFVNNTFLFLWHISNLPSGRSSYRPRSSVHVRRTKAAGHDLCIQDRGQGFSLYTRTDDDRWITYLVFP